MGFCILSSAFGLVDAQTMLDRRCFRMLVLGLSDETAFTVAFSAVLTFDFNIALDVKSLPSPDLSEIRIVVEHLSIRSSRHWRT